MNMCDLVESMQMQCNAKGEMICKRNDGNALSLPEKRKEMFTRYGGIGGAV
jgi:hypothetical protein